MKALSIRQPWAWLIVNGYKGIENRSWSTRVRGPILIHASKGMTRDEYDEARYLTESLGFQLPAFNDLERGGVVGQAIIADCVSESLSPWFFGEYGFVLTDAKPLPFRPFKGQLSFFDVPDQHI